MKLLPVTRFPEIAPPSVVVSLSYPGATAETVAKSVLLPIEEAINGVENMTYIRSTLPTRVLNQTVYFKQEPTRRSLVNVQTLDIQAISSIPSEVNEAG